MMGWLECSPWMCRSHIRAPLGPN